MKIRNRLTLQFTSIVALIMFLFCVTIFYLAEFNRKKNFKNKLQEKALNTARLLIEVDAIDANLLKDIRRNYLQSLPLESVRVYDKNNTPVYRDDTFSFKLTPEKLNSIREKKELNYTSGEREFVCLAYNIRGHYVIVASAIDIEGKRENEFFKLILVVCYLICLVVILLSGRVFAKNSLKPISQIISQVKKISVSKLHLRVDEGKNKDEISELASEFNQLFSKVEQAFEMQKRFVSNASHELRTPLTTIIGEIDVVLLKDRERQEYKEVLLSILDEAKKLRRLSNGLLDLAQIGMEQNLINIYPIAVTNLLCQIKEKALKINKSNELIIESFGCEDSFISGNEELLLMVFNNLLANAFKFSDNKPVKLIVYIKDNDVVFNVIDEGIGIAKEDIEHVFQPFYRSSNATTVAGYGIGLSLAKKIISLHEGAIQVNSELNKGTTFKITFPLY